MNEEFILNISSLLNVTKFNDIFLQILFDCRDTKYQTKFKQMNIIN